MRLLIQKSILGFTIIVFAFSPAFMAPQPARAGGLLGDFGGELAVTALGCSGILDKVTSALSSLTGSLLGQANGEVPVTDASTHSKESCLDAIAYTAAKIVLAKITESTLNWINTGFAGSPTFVQNPGTFFQSIADEQVSTFTAQIAFDPNNFPFGRITAQNIIGSIQKQLDYNAKVSSGNLLNYDNNPNIPYAQRFDNFTNDFLYGGGWDGYLAVTQITQANPFDSYIQSVNQIGPVVNAAKQQANPITQVTAELQQSGGFLTLKKCTKPSGYEPPSADTSFTLEQAQAQSQNDPSDPDTIDALLWLSVHVCEHWETQTPGTAIAQQMNISLGQSQRQLELADELNESISAVFDALIKQLFNKGVASLSGETSGGGSNVNVMGGFGNNTGNTTITSGGSSSGNNGTQWYQQNQTFDLKEALAPGGLIDDQDCLVLYDANGNILNHDASGETINPASPTNTDCNQGLAVVQESYANALRAESLKLQHAILWINYADYCVPGPRPDWYQNAAQNVSSLQQRFSDIAQKTDEDKRANDSYMELKYFTGFAANYADTVNLENPNHAFNAIWQTLRSTTIDEQPEGYKEFIEQRYSTANAHYPLISLLINQEYAKKARYQSIIESNLAAAAEAQTMSLRLANLYQNIIDGEAQYPAGTPERQKFMDNELKIFSRLVSEIKSGTDIDNIISDIRLADDEIDLVGGYSAGGLIKQCIDQTTNINTILVPFGNGFVPEMTRRRYGEPKATAQDFTDMGWPNGDPLASYSPRQSFLMDVTITAQTVAGGAVTPQPGIYIGHYVNQCLPIPLGGSISYSSCNDGDTTLTNSSGDRFEQHINSY